MSEIQRVLLLPHIKVHNANALSSPFTIGFPAMTAWLGAVHALQRKLNAKGYDAVKFISVGVVSHQCDLQTHKGVGDYVHSIIGTGNPLDKTGSRSAFIEEARCHLDVSLIIEYTGTAKENEDAVKDKITQLLNSSMKMAGGDILTFNLPDFFKIEAGNTKDIHKLIRKVMPGYALIERRDLMIEAMEQGQDAIDAVLDNLAIHHTATTDENTKGESTVTWSSKRKTKGWIVPIATGFHGLTELGQAKNQRDPNTLHRFAESVVTLGEFKMPHRIKSLNEILWSYHADIPNNLYLCTQNCVTKTTNLSPITNQLSTLFD
ncbi:CRISPR-associated protein, Csy2 family [Psychromonas ingrahamii 37]|uniref:CRISPR-associated protein, Csy2 family n=1 Tax=Psychromonas ingrahamii (strain DSM 17664 / CCUG 51855 / 37) TaxID=357804 RepID=A1SUQ1_PSYIN|nr:type I-F CRISPR-associated protein Csy2 [Psychromonas ingrahamii]ABM03216.1 CRISPR-associated protein, Csy2 family [Psychromonas ingrahamii 37]